MLVIDLYNAIIECHPPETIEIALAPEVAPPLDEWVVEIEKDGVVSIETIGCTDEETDSHHGDASHNTATPTQSASGLSMAISKRNRQKSMALPSASRSGAVGATSDPTSAPRRTLRLQVSQTVLPEWHCILATCAATAVGRSLQLRNESESLLTPTVPSAVIFPGEAMRDGAHALVALNAALHSRLRELQPQVAEVQSLIAATRELNAVGNKPSDTTQSPVVDGTAHHLRTAISRNDGEEAHREAQRPAHREADGAAAALWAPEIMSFCREDKVARLAGVVSGSRAGARDAEEGEDGKTLGTSLVASPLGLEELARACVRLSGELERVRDAAVVQSVSVAIDSN